MQDAKKQNHVRQRRRDSDFESPFSLISIMSVWLCGVKCNASEFLLLLLFSPPCSLLLYKTTGSKEKSGWNGYIHLVSGEQRERSGFSSHHHFHFSSQTFTSKHILLLSTFSISYVINISAQLRHLCN